MYIDTIYAYIAVVKPFVLQLITKTIVHFSEPAKAFRNIEIV